jgi:hypothetical protein
MIVTSKLHLVNKHNTCSVCAWLLFITIIYGLEGTNFGFRQQQGTFLFSRSIPDHRGVRHNQPLIQRVPRLQGCWPRVKGRGMSMTTHLFQVQSLRMNGAIITLHLYAFVARRGTTQCFSFFTMLQKTGVCVVAQAVSRRLLTAEDHVQSPAKIYTNDGNSAV